MQKGKKPLIDISEQMNENKNKYYFSKITNFWYNQTPKVKTYITGAFLLTIGLATWLGPCGGLNSFKAHVTKPLVEKITGLKSQNAKIVKEKNKLAKDYSNIKQEKENYAKETERYKQYSADAAFMELLYDSYDPTKQYKVNSKLEGGLVVKTKAMETGETVKDVKTNMMWCASRLKFEQDALLKYLGNKWASKYHKKFIKNEIDVLINTPDSDWGNSIYTGKWVAGSFISEDEIKINGKVIDGIGGYFKK